MLTWYVQEQATSCVAACIRMVLTSFSQTYTELQIRQMIGAPKLGLSLTTAVSRLNQHEAISQAHEDWNLDDIRDSIRAGYFPIVGVERHLLGYPPASHAVVIVNVTSNGVELLDPLDGPQPKQFSLLAFQQAWNSAGQEALVIEAPPTRNEQENP